MGEFRPYDHVCAICDDGGTIISCKGKCLRSFHPIRTNAPFHCETLGFTEKTLNDIDSYMCGNCQHNIHQCFACGKLGSSANSNREVYLCSVKDCGHHYHPICVSKLFYPNNDSKSFHQKYNDSKAFHEKNNDSKAFHEKNNDSKAFHEKNNESKAFHEKNNDSKAFHEKNNDSKAFHEKNNDSKAFHEKNNDSKAFHEKNNDSKAFHEKNNDSKASSYAEELIKPGIKLICPRHKCEVCKGDENSKIFDLQFALCRRCPLAYHRRCLPREILFRARGSEMTRAWNDLIPDRILFYCIKHEIDPNLGTPKRDHLIYPKIYKQEKLNPKIVVKSKFLSDSNKQPDKIRLRISEEIKLERESNFINREKQRGSENYLDKGKPKILDIKLDKGKQKVLDNNSYLGRQKYPENNNSPKEKKICLGNNNFPKEKKVCLGNNISYREKRKLSEIEIEHEANKYLTSFPEIDNSTKIKIRELYEKSSALVTIESIRERFKMPLTHRGMTKHIDLSITQDQIKHAIKMINDAFLRVQKGEARDQVKKDCPEEVLLKIAKWRNKMSVYLAPFIHMNRYTSFGRHFTKVDKLVTIVERLQWYIQDGDMIVDFCCGSNDFSIIMRDKLQSIGKKCFFKNFDLQEPKNDFNFEKRDWMTVQPDELPDGSRLIMGLNPPFGKQAGLANKFIDQALKFRPKIIILIVPKETERLDEKAEYELTWQDAYLLSGKSFYLPGSIDDEHNRMEQWNLNPPPLYLWTRKDWALLHSQIAQKHGHLSQFQQEDRQEEEEELQTLVNPNSSPMELELEQELNPNSSSNESEQVLDTNPSSMELEQSTLLSPNFKSKELLEETLNRNSDPKESGKPLNPYSKPKESFSLSLSEEDSESSEYEELESESKSESEEDDEIEGEKEKEETARPSGSAIEEGEITDLPPAIEASKAVNNKNDDDQDVSGELIFLADMDISSPEYGEFQSACTKGGLETESSSLNNNNKGFETGGSSKIQSDYASSDSDPSGDPFDHDDPLALGWWSDEDEDQDEDE